MHPVWHPRGATQVTGGGERRVVRDQVQKNIMTMGRASSKSLLCLFSVAVHCLVKKKQTNALLVFSSFCLFVEVFPFDINKFTLTLIWLMMELRNYVFGCW